MVKKRQNEENSPLLVGLLSWFCVCVFFQCVFAEEKLAFIQQEFQNPPAEYGIRCYWWWLNSHVTKDAITRDLEQMKEKGFGGALIVDAGGAEQWGNRQIPAGPAFLSPTWRELFKHAVYEAYRLGLELSLNIQSGWNLGGPVVEPEESAKMLTWSQTFVTGPETYRQKLAEPKKRGNYYQDIVVLAYPERSFEGDSPAPPKRPIRNLKEKAIFQELGMSAPDCRFLLTDVSGKEGEEDTKLGEIVDISRYMDSNGQLDWDVPAGRWVVFRFGYTLNGSSVSTSSEGWEGLVIDYMDKGAIGSYWKKVVEPLLEDVRPLVGVTLKHLTTDSWECGGANWTEKFPEEFKKRRGYDPVVYLPIIAGKIVESRDVSNRFLADFRKTLGDCVAENHYEEFARLAAKYELGIHPESGGPHAGPFDALKCLGRSTMPFGEFWIYAPHRQKPENWFFMKQPASAAHIYGRKLVGAEAFTSIEMQWNDVLWARQKPRFDHEVCSGMNLVFVHTFTCSPKEMGYPGQEYFAGTHFNPQVTWWEQAGAFIRYLNRCQFILQQGQFKADVLYYYGDHVPNLVQMKEADPAGVLPGYDYDVTNEEVLLKAQVRDNRVVLPSGMSYRLLVLPNHRVLFLAVLKKVQELVGGGLLVVGPKPEKAVSLVGWPGSEKEFGKIANAVWGKKPEETGSHRYGQGKVVWGKSAKQVLLEEGILPDFEISGAQSDSVFDYIHYVIDNADVYFVCNQKEQEEDGVCSFRVSGRRPELWDAVTGQIREVGAFRQEEDRTKVPLKFGPYGSMFVIFREKITPGENGTAKSNFPEYTIVETIGGPWQVGFDPKWGGPEKVEFAELESWTENANEGIRYYSGKATYTKGFSFTKQDGDCYLLDLGRVGDVGIAQVHLNGKDAGVVWCKPFRVEISGLLRSGENVLEIDVVNSWRNRLVGDRGLPEDERFTRTNITIRRDWELLESGLLGPIQILVEAK